MGELIRIAACQMDAELGNVGENLARAGRLLEDAFSKGAMWVVLPEFFPTAGAFHPVMDGAALPFDGPALALMRDAARRHFGHVGGSFIAVRGGERFNTFVLVRPDGTYATHDKDQPTMWEGCYYKAGADDGILEAGGHAVGAVLCWEFIRSRTARRLAGKVDLVVGGSGWWSYPELPLVKTLLAGQHRLTAGINERAFARMARQLGVPVVHAAHCGTFVGKMPLSGGLPYPAHFLGETQIVDARGEILARRRREEGAGVAVADIRPGRGAPTEAIGDGFWTEPLPWTLSLTWHLLNAHARRYYRRAAARRRVEP